MRKFFAYEILSGSGKFKRKDTLRFVTRVGFVIFILIGLTSCMSMPFDQQHFNNFAPGIEVPFMGAVPLSKTVITIEAQDPANNAWEKIGQFISGDRPFNRWGQDWYLFGGTSKRLKIPEKYWEPALASVEYMATVRARIGGTVPVISMKEAPAACFALNTTTLADFQANCQANNEGTATVYARRDFHQECVDMINYLRSLEGEGLPPYGRYKEAEECSDEDARLNFENGGHFRNGCVEGQSSAAGQNKTKNPVGTLNGVLSAIKDGMYTQEKQCYEADTCDTCPASNSCGHYLNIIGAEYDYDRVSCGVYVTPDGRFANVQNFWLRGKVIP